MQLAIYGTTFAKQMENIFLLCGFKNLYSSLIKMNGFLSVPVRLNDGTAEFPSRKISLRNGVCKKNEQCSPLLKGNLSGL